MANPNASHKAVLRVYSEIHEVLPDGQCTGDPTHKRIDILEINGSDQGMTVKKLSDFISEVKTKCRTL